jgi:hypothetical protein
MLKKSIVVGILATLLIHGWWVNTPGYILTRGQEMENEME